MEDTLAGIDAYFTAELPAMIDTIETERSVTIPDLAAIETARVKDRQYPYLELIPGEVEYVYGDETEPLVSDPMEEQDAVAAVRHAGSERAEVQLVLMRYLEAIRRVSLADNTYGGRFDWARPLRASFVKVVDAQEKHKLVQELQVTLRVRVYR